MSKNKELVAEAIAAIPLWIAFLDKKEAEQDALLAEMQGKKKKTFMQKIVSRFKKEKEESEGSSLLPSQEESPDSNLLPANQSVDSDSETPPKVKLEKENLDSAARWAPKTTEEEENQKEEDQEDQEEEDQEEENQLGDFV